MNSFLFLHTESKGRQVLTRPASHLPEQDPGTRSLSASRLVSAAFKLLARWAAENGALDALIIEAREFADMQTRIKSHLLKEALAAATEVVHQEEKAA